MSAEHLTGGDRLGRDGHEQHLWDVRKARRMPARERALEIRCKSLGGRRAPLGGAVRAWRWRMCSTHGTVESRPEVISTVLWSDTGPEFSLDQSPNATAVHGPRRARARSGAPPDSEPLASPPRAGSQGALVHVGWAHPRRPAPGRRLRARRALGLAPGGRPGQGEAPHRWSRDPDTAAPRTPGISPRRPLNERPRS